MLTQSWKGKAKEEAVIKKGLMHRCSLSKVLLNLYIWKAVDKIGEGIRVGINIQGGGKVDMIRFADGIAITTENEEELQEIIKEIG